MRQGHIEGDSGDHADVKVTTKKCTSAEEAKWKYEELIANRIDKGYQLARSAEEEKAEELAKDAAVPKAKSEDLIKAIHKSPKSPDAYLVYGDWLQSQGDPRGELIALHAEIEKRGLEVGTAARPVDGEIGQQARELIARHDRRWLGLALSNASVEELDCGWRFGFLRTLRMGGTYALASLTNVWPELMSTGSAEFLEELVVNQVDPENGRTMYGQIIDDMAKHGVPTSLRRLSFDANGGRLLSSGLGDLSPLYPQLKRLEELLLRVGKMDLGDAMSLPALEKLSIITTSLSAANLASIAKGSWKKLRDLTIYIGTREDAAIAHVRPLLRSKVFPALKSLAICNSSFENDIVKAVVASDLLPQLSHLDFSYGTLNDVGGEAMLTPQAIDRLSHIKTITINHGFLTRAMIGRLRDAFGKAMSVQRQNRNTDDDDDDYGDDGDDDRYVSLNE